MNIPVTAKVCGLTREEDIELALSLGARYCGLILFSDSPRSVSIERAKTLLRLIPAKKRVLVDVNTPADVLSQIVDELPFDYFQIHCSVEAPLVSLASWAGLVGTERLWVAPRVPPQEEFPESIFDFCDTCLVDTFHKDKAGGTGETGDWGRFAKWQDRYANKNFILAGGLNPVNIPSAIEESGARTVDVNSGVEIAPGVKDKSLMEAFFAAIKTDINGGERR